MEKDRPTNIESSEETSITPEIISIAKKGVHRILTESMETQPDSENPDKNAEKLETPEPSKAEKKAKSFIESRKKWFRIFSGDGSLAYKVSDTAETFAFYPGVGKVEFPVKWFDEEAEKTFEEKELVFSSAHELCHFMDMRENPEAFLENFDRMEKVAKEKAEEYCKDHPEADEQQVAQIIHREIHTLYNCLDDIYVNSLAASLAKTYSTNSRDSVISLYEKIGYKDADLTKAPLHLQMAYALLRDDMIGEERGKSKVSDEVRDILDKRSFGFSLRDKLKQLKPQRGKKVNPKERYKIIQESFEPKYFELLFKDLDELLKQEQENPNGSDNGKNGRENGNENDGNDRGEDSSENSKDNRSENNRDDSGNDDGEDEGEDGGENGRNDESENGDYDPFKKYKKAHFFSDHDDKAVREALDEFKEEKDVEKMDPKQRAEHERKKKQKKFDKDHGIEEEERTEFEKISAKIAKSRQAMRSFWDNLIGKSVEFKKKTVDRQLKGDIDLRKPVKTFIELTENLNEGHPEKARIYTRTETERIPTDKPEEIQITLLVDGSGSMDGDGIQVAKETATLLMLSIMDFNHRLESRRRETGSNLTAKTEVVMFGSEGSEETIKPFEKKRVSNKDEADLIKTVSQIDASYNGTADASSFEKILIDLSDEDKKRIKDGKLLKIVFEITDGGTFTKDKTQQAVVSLNSSGVLTFGFQIGPKNEIFDEIWNGNSTGKEMGINIGNNPNSLPEQLINLLTEILKDIKI